MIEKAKLFRKTASCIFAIVVTTVSALCQGEVSKETAIATAIRIRERMAQSIKSGSYLPVPDNRNPEILEDPELIGWYQINFNDGHCTVRKADGRVISANLRIKQLPDTISEIETISREELTEKLREILKDSGYRTLGVVVDDLEFGRVSYDSERSGMAWKCQIRATSNGYAFSKTFSILATVDSTTGRILEFNIPALPQLCSLPKIVLTAKEAEETMVQFALKSLKVNELVILFPVEAVYCATSSGGTWSKLPIMDAWETAPLSSLLYEGRFWDKSSWNEKRGTFTRLLRIYVDPTTGNVVDSIIQAPSGSG